MPCDPLDVEGVRRPRRASAPLGRGARYEFGDVIGRGGMGEVIAAYDTQIGREVAIKRLHPDQLTEEARAGFLREARIQGWLEHPSIPAVHEVGNDDEGRPFFVMKRLSGVTLHEVLRNARPRPTEQQLLRVFVEICMAIEFAHTRGVLHRDLKPANILLGDFGEVYVLDWGLAQVLQESVAPDVATRLTTEQAARTSGPLGTPGYMSPEQIRGDELDGRADVYALGCVLFEILVGRRLHPDGVAGLTSALAGVSSSFEACPELAPELAELCRRATATDRADRIGSARAFGGAVQRYLDGDRDLALRRQLARDHLENARRAVRERAAPAVAMREAGRALALDPTLPGAAELVGRLMLEPPSPTPTAVIAELTQSRLDEQVRRAKLAIGIYAGYIGVAVLLAVLGIDDAFYLLALVGVATLNLGLAATALFRGRIVPRTLTAITQAMMFAVLARMFTPVFIAPGIMAITLMVYALHPATHRRELVTASAFALAAVLGVWAAELCGVLSATMIVEGGRVQLIPPLDGIAEFPIVPALACYAIVIVAVGTQVAYAGARRSRQARHDLQVRAWSLRQLVSLDASRG